MKAITIIEALDASARVLEGVESAHKMETELSVTFGLIELWRKREPALDPTVSAIFATAASLVYLSKTPQAVGLRVATSLQLLCLRMSDTEALKKEQALAAVYLRQASEFLRAHGYPK